MVVKKMFFLLPLFFIIFSFMSMLTLHPLSFASEDCSSGTVSCQETIGIGTDIDTCSQTCSDSSYRCSYDAAKNCTYESGVTICNGVCKKSSTTYQKGDCDTGSICYTDTQGPDQAPGYACGVNKGQINGNTSTYVYTEDTGKKGYIKNCHLQGPGSPAGVCCTQGTPLPSLPDHGSYELEAQQVGFEGARFTCPGNTLSICYDGDTGNESIIPGLQCGSLSGWHLGTDGSGKVPHCGSGWCCDTGGPNVTAPPPNPCPSENGICTQIDTAVGTIDVSGPGGFIAAVFGILLSLAGGTALVLIIFSGYQIMTAQGDPEKVKAAQERLTSAVIGLLFMIFSVTILQILGVDILHIPGFGK